MLNPDELEALSREYFPEPIVAQQLPEPTLSSTARVGEHLANLASYTGSMLTRDFVGLGQMFISDEEKLKMSEEELRRFQPVPKVFDIPDPHTVAEKAIDYVGEGLIPGLAASLVPYGAVSRAMKAAKVAPMVGEMVAQSLTGGFMGAGENPEAAGLGLVEGAFGGGTQKLGRVARLAPSLAFAGGDYVANRAMGRTPTEAALSAGVVGLFNQIVPKIGHEALSPLPVADGTRIVDPTISTPINHLQVAEDSRIQQLHQDAADFIKRDSTLPFIERPASPTQFVEPHLLDLEAQAMRQKTEAPAQVWLHSMGDGPNVPPLRALDPLPPVRDVSFVHPVADVVNGVVAADARGGVPHLVDLPSKPIVEPTISARAVEGAAPAFPSTERAGVADPHDFVPAIKVGEIVVKGRKGETHGDIRDRYIAEHPEEAGDILMDFDTKQNPNFFLNKKGESVSRLQLKEAIGVSDSQGLTVKQLEAPIKSAPSLQEGRMTAAVEKMKAREASPDLHTLAVSHRARFDGLDVSAGKNKFTILDDGRQAEIFVDRNASKGEIVDAIIRERSKHSAEDIQKTVDDLAATLKKEGLDPKDFFNSEQMRFYDPEAAVNPVVARMSKPLEGAIVEPQSSGKMRLGGLGQAGSADDETLMALGGGAIGGAYGFYQTGTVMGSLAYAMIGAGLGHVGLKALKNLKTNVGPTNPGPAGGFTKTEVGMLKKMRQFWKDTVEMPAGYAVAGRGGIFPGTVRGAEMWAGFNAPWWAKEAKMRAEGIISKWMGELQKHIEAANLVKPTRAFIDKASLYLKGQLAPKAEVEAILKKGGSITQEEWDKTLPAFRSHLTERHVVKDDVTNTNTRGEGIQIWRTTNATKAELKALQDTHLIRAAGSDPNDKVYMALPMKAREVFNNIQDIFLDAVPQGPEAVALRNKLIGTHDQYQTRTFGMFTDKNHYPTALEIDNRMTEMARWTEDNFLEKIPVIDKSDHAQPGFTLVNSGRTISPGSTIVPLKPVYLRDARAAEFKGLYNDMMLKSDVEHEIRELKMNRKLYSDVTKSNDMDASLFGGRKQLTQTYRELLGEHKSVGDEITYTMNRLSGSAQAAKMITIMADQKLPHGLKMAYNDSEWVAATNQFEQIIKTATDPEVVRNAQHHLEDLKSYIPTGEDPRLGVFGNKRISRFAHDQLKDYKSPWGIFENPVGRSLSQFNNFSKQVHAPYSPITQVRNVISVPAFLAMGRATDPGSLVTAWKLLRNKSHPLWGRMRELGIENANQSQGEFKYGMHELVNGELDGSITKALKGAHKFVLDKYAAPDLFVRIATFLSAEKRFGEKNPKWSASEIESAAMKWTSERTMDYSNVPAWVKTARQLPFVNMYISYAYEAIRIMGNMAKDAAGGDIHAGATLAAVATIPFILQAGAEGMLTPEQRKKWNMANRFAPDYSRTRFKLPTGREDSKGNMHYVDITPLNVIDNYAQMVRAVGRGDSQAAWAVNPVVGWTNTPLFAVMSAQIAGHDLQTHRDFRDWNDRFTAVLRDILPAHMPGIGYEAQKLTPESLGGTFNVTNLKTGRTDDIWSALSKHITGAAYTSVNPGIVLNNAKKQLQHDVTLERQFLNDVLKSTASPEHKALAYKIAQESIKSHMYDFIQKTDKATAN